LRALFVVRRVVAHPSLIVGCRQLEMVEVEVIGAEPALN